MQKFVFYPFLTPFWSQIAQFTRHLGVCHVPKRATMCSKRGKITCLSNPSGLGTSLEKTVFFAPVTLVDPTLAPTERGPRCPPAPPSYHLYRGLGVSLGDSEASKPQKVGGCGWERCPRNSLLTHLAKDTPRSSFWACLAQTPHIQAILGRFWAVSRTYRGARGQERILGHEAN